MCQQFAKYGGKIGYMVSDVERLKDTQGTANLKALSLGELARMIIIEQHFFRMNFLRQQNCADLSDTQGMRFLDPRQRHSILNFLNFDPLRFRNFQCSWKSCAVDHHFAVDLLGNPNSWKELIDEVEAAKLRENRQRR